MSDVIIKKGTIEIKIDRNSLIDCKPVGDGIVFLTKENIEMRVTDSEMPSQIKNILAIHTSNASKKNSAKMIIDLDNRIQPISFTSN